MKISKVANNISENQGKLSVNDSNADNGLIYLLLWVNYINVYGSTSTTIRILDGVGQFFIIFLVKLLSNLLLLPLSNNRYLYLPLSKNKGASTGPKTLTLGLGVIDFDKLEAWLSTIDLEEPKIIIDVKKL